MTYLNYLRGSILAAGLSAVVLGQAQTVNIETGVSQFNVLSSATVNEIYGTNYGTSDAIDVQNIANIFLLNQYSSAYTDTGLAGGWVSQINTAAEAAANYSSPAEYGNTIYGTASSAQWIGVSSDSWYATVPSAIFETTFSVATSGFYSMAFNYSADDTLGNQSNSDNSDSNLSDANEGIYVDGLPGLPASASNAILWDQNQEFYAQGLVYLTSGSHNLYFDTWNEHDYPSGLILDGQISYLGGAGPNATPEPFTLVLSLGGIALAARRARARKQA